LKAHFQRSAATLSEVAGPTVARESVGCLQSFVAVYAFGSTHGNFNVSALFEPHIIRMFAWPTYFQCEDLDTHHDLEMKAMQSHLAQ
jgi:hypothetical protein